MKVVLLVNASPTAGKQVTGKVVTDLAYARIAKIMDGEPDDSRRVAAEMIITRVAVWHGITVKELMGLNRKKNIAQARRIAIYMVRDLTAYGFIDIGTLFSRDSSTVQSACRSVRDNEDDKAVAEYIAKGLEL